MNLVNKMEDLILMKIKIMDSLIKIIKKIHLKMKMKWMKKNKINTIKNLKNN